MGFGGPKIIKKNGGLGRKAPSDRNVAALVIAKGYAVGTTFALGGTYTFNSLAEAEAIGLGPDTDANNAATHTCLTYYHISEYFRLNPDGKLWVLNLAAGTPATIFDAAGQADVLMNAASKSIRYFGLVLGGAPDEVVTVTNGADGTVWAMQVAAQLWVQRLADAYVYVDNVMIEGKSLATTAPTYDLHQLASPQVSMVWGNDQGYLAPYIAVDPGHAKTGAVGSALGSIGVRKLCESIASVDIEQKPANKRSQADYTLVDTLRGRWLVPGLSSGVKFDNLTPAIRQALENFGYIYMGRYEGYPGVYLSDSATCEALDSDFCTIENNRVWNQAARMARLTLVPRMNATIDIDPATGYIRSTTIASWTAGVKRVLEDLVKENEASAVNFSINPAQNVLGGDPVKTLMSVTPRGIAKAIEAELGYDNPLNI